MTFIPDLARSYLNGSKRWFFIIVRQGYATRAAHTAQEAVNFAHAIEEALMAGIKPPEDVAAPRIAPISLVDDEIGAVINLHDEPHEAVGIFWKRGRGPELRRLLPDISLLEWADVPDPAVQGSPAERGRGP